MILKNRSNKNRTVKNQFPRQRAGRTPPHREARNPRTLGAVSRAPDPNEKRTFNLQVKAPSQRGQNRRLQPFAGGDSGLAATRQTINRTLISKVGHSGRVRVVTVRIECRAAPGLPKGGIRPGCNNPELRRGREATTPKFNRFRDCCVLRRLRLPIEWSETGRNHPSQRSPQNQSFRDMSRYGPFMKKARFYGLWYGRNEKEAVLPVIALRKLHYIGRAVFTRPAASLRFATRVSRGSGIRTIRCGVRRYLPIWPARRVPVPARS